MDLTYIKRTGESNADAGDQYIGLDRFGRSPMWWVNTIGPTTLDLFQSGYDATHCG